MYEGLALIDGTSLGFKEGDWLAVGSCVGWIDGISDGLSDGVKDGISDGTSEGWTDGIKDGALLVEGTLEG